MDWFLAVLGLPESGLELMSPALADRFLTTEPPGEAQERISGHTNIQCVSQRREGTKA